MDPRARSPPVQGAVLSPLRAAALLLTALVGMGCSTASKPSVIRLDYATYNPVGLLLKDKGYLEEALRPEGIGVEWVKSLGSNKALEFLNSKSIDFGSSAGAAALIARSNQNPIRAVYVYSKPEWTALVTRADSDIKSVADLKGKKVAVTRGTDPYVFLLRALDSTGLTEQDVELVPLQHPDGKLALERGQVDAWAGLDPLMATSELESGSRIFFRRPDWNSYGVLDVREEFAKQYPGYVQRVLQAYEQARDEARSAPNELRESLIREAHLSDAVATRVLERTDLSSATLGDAQQTAISEAGSVLKKTGVIRPEVDPQAVTAALLDRSFSARLNH